MSTPTTRPSGPTASDGQEAVHPGAAAEVEDRLARGDLRQVEEVADARERVDRGRGDAVEFLGG